MCDIGLVYIVKSEVKNSYFYERNKTKTKTKKKQKQKQKQ